MKIFGYDLDTSVLDEDQGFDEYTKPTFDLGTGEKAKIGCIVTHGIGGTPANMYLVTQELKKRGYTVLAPCLPGHGTTVRDQNASTGKQWLQCLLDAYDRLKENGCTDIIPIGLSLGGVLSAVLAEERPCAALVLISTPVRMKAWLHAARLMSPVARVVRYGEETPEEKAAVMPYGQMYNGFSPPKLNDLHRLTLRLRRNAKRITCPVLALWAKLDDKVADSTLPLMERKLKHTEYRSVIMERSLHGSTYRPPERDLVATRVADYVDEIAGRILGTP